MQLTKTEIEILKVLVSSSDFISSYDIATATGIHRRSVRDEMMNIKSILKNLGYHLISKTSKGYMIEGKSMNSHSKLQKVIEYSERQRESLFPTLPIERENYILKRLIEIDDYIKIDDLASELLISRSTISCDLKNVKKDFIKYGLVLKQKPNYGICICGNEINKRKPLCDLIFTNLNQSEMFYDFLGSYFNDKESTEYGVINIIKNHHILLSDYALCDFLICLSISINRISQGHTITEAQDLSLIDGRPEFLVAIDIAHFIEDKLALHINQYEINQIAIQLICKRSTSGLKPTTNPEILKLVNQIFKEIGNQTLLSFNNSSFISTFCLYVENALIRNFYKEKVRNPFYSTMQSYTPLGYECALIASSVICDYTHQSLSRSELAFFAIIFHKAIYNQEFKKKSTLLICGLGGGTGSLCKATILESFQNQIDIKKVINYYNIYDEDLSTYDLVISTAPIHKNLSIPYINISPLINQDDLNQIKSYLSYFFNRNKMITLFHPRLFKNNVIIKNRNELTNEWYKLIKLLYPSTKESIKNTLKNKSFVSFSEGNIDIIKLYKPINNNNTLVVLMLDKPLFIDQEEKNIFIFFSCQDTDHYIHNTLVNALSNLIQNRIDYEYLLKYPTYQNFLEMITKYQ